MKETNNVKLFFLNSLETDLDLYQKFPRYARFDSGQDNYSIFLGHLKEIILNGTKNKSKKEKIGIVRRVLKPEYVKYKPILDHNIKIVEEEWNSLGPKFLEACEKTFDGHKFPNGDYKAIMTIWGRYPCIRNKKTFYFPAHLQYMWLVILHELLHFAFFSYFSKHFNVKLEREKLWTLAEVLNILIMNEEPYLSWAKMPSVPYPSNKKTYEKMVGIFNSRVSMKGFIEKAIVVLKGR